jgi:hypothetical protein
MTNAKRRECEKRCRQAECESLMRNDPCLKLRCMFRIHTETATATGDLLMPVDALLEPDSFASWDLPTQTELILSHAEPRNWMPPVSINLRRFLADDMPARGPTTLPESVVQQSSQPVTTSMLQPAGSVSESIPAKRTQPLRHASPPWTKLHSVNPLKRTRTPQYCSFHPCAEP